ncbi:hypothetical protein GcM1_226094 [Golovinomyces cichoracearum]|uniref:Uncharacterized protein n=1 Tax=Golovinomyces cichoracearum TaxID=62708 RepID=A0A420IQ09_9PEZI|nr:hypothetical protein GcM1_226094 [Golovinomyces cichoracearum]
MYEDASNYVAPYHCNLHDSGLDLQELPPQVNPSSDLPKFRTPENQRDVIKEYLYWRKRLVDQDLFCNDSREPLKTYMDDVVTFCNGATLTQDAIQGLRAGADKAKSMRAQHSRKALFKGGPI